MNAPLRQPATASVQVADAVSDAQVRSFVDDGFLVVPDLVAPAEIELLKRDTADLARGKYPCKSLQPLPADLDDQQVLESLLCIHQPHNVSPVIKDFVTHAGICGVLGRIVAAHLPHWDGAVKCMQSMLFVKPPGKPGQAWHQDEMYIPTRDRSLCGAWIAIDDATIENGCLWVVPGSHRDGYLFPSKSPEDLVEYDGSNQCYEFDEAKAVPVEVKSGSVVFFNGYLLHKSLRNRSTIYRRALVSHYMNSWSLLPWSIPKEGTSVATADIRRVIQVCGTDPYAHKGYDPPGDDVHLRKWGEAWQKVKAAAAVPKS
ncbi:hypothetical protein LBMAG53_09350 [Planctomycetota bacterium]|nr:hypothetical protein LBMAG53_09350 [Planctomycetota bacterium]